jgi:hypothetical protein
VLAQQSGSQMLDHRLQLTRRSRQQQHGAIARTRSTARGASMRVLEHLRAFRHHRLAPVDLGHRAGEPGGKPHAQAAR